MLLVRYVTKHLKKWQQSSAKWLIANICLQYYMNHVKTLHVFLPHNMDEPCAPFKRVSVQCFAAGPSNKRLPQKHLFFCSDLTSTVFYSASVFCFVFSFPMCFVCIWRNFRFVGVFKSQRSSEVWPLWDTVQTWGASSELKFKNWSKYDTTTATKYTMCK